MKPALDISWARRADLSEVPSPALLLGVEAIRENLHRMVKLAGDPARLRPHVKTHKSAWLVQEQIALGITRFKCATIAEAEMCAQAGAPDVLLGLQPAGPNVARLLALQAEFPRTTFSTIVDDPGIVETLAKAAAQAKTSVSVLLDIDVGQHRTGVVPGPAAVSLYRQITAAGSLSARGLHAYDGHLHQTDPEVRAAACEQAYAPVEALRQELLKQGMSVSSVVVGGTPTFPMHAARANVECSPGTCVLWDAGYATNLPDLAFVNAAVLLTRVISKPGKDRLCLDLGHKAVASEMPQPRVVFPDLPEAEAVAHNEEHLVLSTDEAERFSVGDMLLGVPWHICPTVALHSEATIIENDQVWGTRKIDARGRKLRI